ncbi:D-alanine--D-alanyl carrier protein ligase [Seminavis robusta]|uniref:D-alanine--D-alanyl carrier protein ligase n=1 Tax=Seminavis robusta TaxID=568900 RepID=A0A9N8EGD7_9STRA|nr:D-alanine--D-alanyl carrier protein ligase [Seminavis robusta]|eukprot:Sro962_g225060.1 D-alanine--D-alanyl carrier protein ligase (1382) ;mRNA; r:1927-6150
MILPEEDDHSSSHLTNNQLKRQEQQGQRTTMSFSTILEALDHHAGETPDKIVLTWVDKNCDEQNKMTFTQLEDTSNAVAARLLKLGCQKGDRVMVAYPFGLEFLAGMFGAMKIGVIPCSIYPPNPNQLKTEMPKFRRFAEDAGAKYALSTNTFATAMAAASVLYKTGVTWIGTDKISTKKSKSKTPNAYETYMGEPNDICFIQYTSGSTGSPKGVMISHHNLAETCKAGVSLTQCSEPNSLEVLWVPQYHDMGLVTGFMGAIFSGNPLVMASPLDFILNPLLWTDMVERYQATITSAPNFAYALLLKRLEQANRKADWSCVKRAMFGGEPAQSHVVEAVAKNLSVKPDYVYNIYGMAEMVVLVTGGTAKPDPEGLVCCGEVDSPTLKLRIVQDGQEVEDGQVGSIWAQSPRVAVGYYGQPELTKSTFSNALPGYDGTWLDTGDLGKIVDGQLYITGRIKDVIIINGKNYYPTDVEHSIDASFGHIVRPGRTTAFQYREDSVGITCEPRKDFDKSANKDLAVQIANHVSQVHGLFVSEVAVLKSGATPKTTSGKLKRSEVRQTTVAGDWKPSSVILRFQRHDGAIPVEKEGVLKKSSKGNLMEQPCSGITEAIDFESSGGLNPPSTNSPKDFQSLVISIFGSEVDTSKSWAENGITSLKSAELRNSVEEEFHVVLPVNFEQLYTTPLELHEFLASSEGKCFPMQNLYDDPDFPSNSSVSTLSKVQLGVIQSLGSALILLLVLISAVPSYFLVSWVLNECASAEDGECQIIWGLMPMIFPLFLLSFSLDVAFFKFVVIGTYKKQQMELLSWDYIRWWFVDRLVEVWESIVGQFLLETKYIWIFYWLLGADLAWSAKIESYIREFDLVKVGSNATIAHPLKCRKFSQSKEEASPKMTFYPIVVGKNCKVFGMIGPGAKIGDGSKVEKLSAVDEGALVPNGVLARGFPAYNAGPFHQHQESNFFAESVLDVFKMVWAISEAYHFFALSSLVHFALNGVLPSWRYGGILHWFLLFPLTSFLALLTSIALKWILIGKRDPLDEYEGSLYRRATNWACDFHFRVAAWTLAPFFGQSRLWTVILYLHGLDVDIESDLSSPYCVFFPSKVDFVKVGKSFVATSSLDLSKCGDSKIEIINSSIGYNVNLHAGVKIMKSMIPPRSDVSDNVYNLNQSNKLQKPTYLIMDLFLPEVLQLLLNVVIFASFIPTYEIGLAATESSSIAITACGLDAAIVLQLFLWVLLTRLVERLLLILPGRAQQSFFGIYINHVWLFNVGNWLVLLLYGTPMFAYYARMMGAEVDGDLWYFGNALYEYSKLHFEGSVIVDNSHVSGHYVDRNGLAIDDTYVSGLLHPGCYASAGAKVFGSENGPWKLFLRRSDVGTKVTAAALV